MISIISFERLLLKVFKSFITLLSNKKSRFYNLLKFFFFISHYQVFSYEVDDDIINIFCINSEIKRTLFN